MPDKLLQILKKKIHKTVKRCLKKSQWNIKTHEADANDNQAAEILLQLKTDCFYTEETFQSTNDQFIIANVETSNQLLDCPEDGFLSYLDPEL